MVESGGVKLLLDENLSRRIVPLLLDDYPGTTQVALAGLECASDREIWDFAKSGEYVIVTKDDDFLGLLSLLGYPPKVVRLTMGNCPNQQVIDILSRLRPELETLLSRPDLGLVELA